MKCSTDSCHLTQLPYSQYSNSQNRGEPEKTPANVDTERSPRVTFLVERGTVAAETGMGSEH